MFRGSLISVLYFTLFPVLSYSVKEDIELIEAGFEYVTERSRVKIYRKPK